MSDRQLFWFVAILFGLSCTGQIVALFVAGGIETLGESAWLVPIAFSPALCALGFLLMHK
jgi:hypothetical protein